VTIKAVTFDLWATVWYDLHDRQRNERRAEALYDGLRSAGIRVDRDAALEVVYECALYAEVSRRRGGEDFLPRQQVDRMLRRLGVDEERAGGPTAFETLTAAIQTPYEEALLEAPPTLIPGVREAVEALYGRYRLGMVSWGSRTSSTWSSLTGGSSSPCWRSWMYSRRWRSTWATTPLPTSVAPGARD